MAGSFPQKDWTRLPVRFEGTVNPEHVGVLSSLLYIYILYMYVYSTNIQVMPKDLMTTCPQKSSVMIKPARNSLILMDLPKLKLGSASKSERLLSLQAMQPHQDRRSALPLLLSVATVWPL